MTDLSDPPETLNSDIVPRDTGGVIVGATPQAILANATRIADALKGLIESQGLSVGVGRDRKHVEVGGWQAAGAMLGALGGMPLHAETIWSRRADRTDAIVYESRCEVRTLAGETVGAAESLCSSEERNWSSSDEYAIKGMAETRAESRAYRRAIGWVINLAGYSPTPAEEVPAGKAAGPGGEAAPPSVLPAWAAPVNNATLQAVVPRMAQLFEAAGIPVAEVNVVGQRIFDYCSDVDEGGPGMPMCVAHTINVIVDRLPATETPVDPSPVASEMQEPPEASPQSPEAETTAEGTTEP